MIHQTVLPFKLEVTRDTIASHAGLALLGGFCVGSLPQPPTQKSVWQVQGRARCRVVGLSGLLNEAAIAAKNLKMV